MLFNATNAMAIITAGNPFSGTTRLKTHPAENTHTDADPIVEHVDYVKLDSSNIKTVCRVFKMLNAKYLEHSALASVNDGMLIIHTTNNKHEPIEIFNEGTSNASYLEVVKLSSNSDSYMSVYALAGFDYTAITENGIDYLCKYRIIETAHMHNELINTAGQYHVIFN